MALAVLPGCVSPRFLLRKRIIAPTTRWIKIGMLSPEITAISQQMERKVNDSPEGNSGSALTCGWDTLGSRKKNRFTGELGILTLNSSI